MFALLDIATLLASWMFPAVHDGTGDVSVLLRVLGSLNGTPAAHSTVRALGWRGRHIDVLMPLWFGLCYAFAYIRYRFRQG